MRMLLQEACYSYHCSLGVAVSCTPSEFCYLQIDRKSYRTPLIAAFQIPAKNFDGVLDGSTLDGASSQCSADRVQ
jgi:hypothetical protein